MKTPKLIKFTLLSLVLGVAISLPMAAMSQDEKVKPRAAEEAKDKATEKAKKKRRPKTPKASPRPKIPEAKTPSRTERKSTPKQTWLGVAMAPVPEVLREHLELAEGFGIQVESVVKDSPAGKADLHRNDILTQVDDQVLTTPEHLSILIRSKKSGDKVALAFIRKGKPQTMDVVLGESDTIHPRPGSGAIHPLNHHQLQPGGRPPNPHNSREMQEIIKRQQEHHRRVMGNTQRQFRQQHSGPSDKQDGIKKEACPKCALEGSGTKQKQCPDCKLERSGTKKEFCPDCKTQQGSTKTENCPICKQKNNPHQRGGKPPAISVRPGFPLKIFGTTGVVKIDNQEGQLTLSQENNAYTITLKDKKGKQIFSGPYDTSKGVTGLPVEAQSQLKRMKLEDLNVILPKTKAKSEESSRNKTRKGDDIL